MWHGTKARIPIGFVPLKLHIVKWRHPQLSLASNDLLLFIKTVRSHTMPTKDVSKVQELHSLNIPSLFMKDKE